jgi:biotin carboxyl carrier protein
MTIAEPVASAPTPRAESLSVPERLITAPTAGVFEPAPPDVVTCEGEIVYCGSEIGTIRQTNDVHAVASPFTGFFMGLLAMPGERVRPGQPLAWVRITG